MRDRFSQSHSRSLTARRVAEEQRGAVAGQTFAAGYGGLVCHTCKCTIKAGSYAVMIVRDGEKAYTHRYATGCSDAMYAWRLERREAVRNSATKHTRKSALSTNQLSEAHDK